MSLFGNLLWIFFGGGLILCVEYLAGGVILCATIIGIPFGVQVFKLAGLSLTPFGRQICRGRAAAGCLGTVMNVLWILSGGIAISVTHLVFALLTGITIIGIPFARQHIKLASLALAPFGAVVR